MATWKQVWAIEAHGHKTGDLVTVTAKSGKTKHITLGLEIEAGVFTPATEPIEDTPTVSTVGTSEAGLKEAFQAMKARSKATIKEQYTGAAWKLDGRDEM